MMLVIHDFELYADPRFGDDESGDGSPERPYRTLHRAVSSAVGSRWTPVTVRALPGIYSPSSNGETYPLYFNDYVSLCGAGAEVTHLDEGEESRYMIIVGPHTGIYDLHLINLNSSKDFLVYCAHTEGEMARCVLDRDMEQPSNVGFMIKGKSVFHIDSLESYASDSTDIGEARNILIENSYFSSVYLSSGTFIHNEVGSHGVTFKNFHEGWYPIIIRDNVIRRFGDYYYNDGNFQFEDNVCYAWMDVERNLPDSAIRRNVFISDGLGIFGTPHHMTVSHNIVLTPDAYGMYQSESSHVSYIHDILAPYYLHGSQGWQGFGSMMGSDFSLEGCVSLFSRVGAAWGAVSSCRHSVMQYNY